MQRDIIVCAFLLFGCMFYPLYAHAAQDLATLVHNHRLQCPHPNAQTLQLRGADHYRAMHVISVFHGALFDEPQHRTQDILSTVPKCLVLRYHRAFTADDFRGVTTQGVKANLNAADFRAVQPALAAYNALYQDMKSGDSYALYYHPGRGIELLKNGKSLGRIQNETFAAGLLSIWLGPKHNMSDKLRKNLLGER